MCALRALREAGVEEARLKWPNDLVVEGQKLGGILIELRAESAGPACVVIGIGLNVVLGAKVLETIGETGVSAVDLSGHQLGAAARRNPQHSSTTVTLACVTPSVSSRDGKATRTRPGPGVVKSILSAPLSTEKLAKPPSETIVQVALPSAFSA